MAKCIICDHKLSKREKKMLRTSKQAIVFCIDCTISKNKVASKMKRKY